MDRRAFVTLGGTAAALLGTAATPVAAAAMSAGRSVADFGVEPNADRDQTAIIQKAIDATAAEGQALFVPTGRYTVSGLKLAPKSTLIGAPGLSVFISNLKAPVLTADQAPEIALRGLTIAGGGLRFAHCDGLSILDCQVTRAPGDGLSCAGSGMLVSGVRVAACAGSGIRFEGDGMVTGNLVGGCRFGFRLGGSEKLGTFSAVNNMIRGADIGIAVSNAPDGYALITMNMIVGARDGGIRALDGDALIGEDLIKNFSSDSFRYLAIAANVSV
jgi:hypothetical protein